MCGIVGLFRATADSSTDALADGRFERMLGPIVSRGPDYTGTWTSGSRLIQLGHTRLSILDLSDAAHQPFQSRNGHVVVVFNGELYNCETLSSALRARGWVARTRSDTEILTEYIAAFGVERLVADADGMFAFASYDDRDGTLTLARDRFGEKPLFWTLHDGCLLFGSDLRSFAAFSSAIAQLAPESVREYLHWGYVPGEATIWSGVYKLRPGHLLRAVPGGGTIQLERRCYFSPRERADEVERAGLAPPNDDELERNLQRVVTSRLASDVPLGALLSGGIDSSLVVALMRAGGRTVDTFSIGFESPDYDEAHWAKIVAAHLGTQHHELYLSDRLICSSVWELPNLLAEPLADSSLLPTFLVSRFAKAHVTVALSGDGGDEMFGGYTRYARLTSIVAALRLVPEGLRRGLGRVLRDASTTGLGRALGGIPSPVLSRLGISRPGHKLSKFARMMSEDSAAAAYESLVLLGATAFCEPSTAREQTPFSDDWIRSARLHDFGRYLPDDICSKVDRASMAVGLEVRSPLLSLDIFDLAFRYRSSGLMQGVRGKLPLRRVLARHLPEACFERPKMGFGIPVNDWLRGPLAEFAREGLSTLLNSGVAEQAGIHSKALTGLFDNHMSGREPWGAELWSIGILGAWIRAAADHNRFGTFGAGFGNA